MTATEFVLLSTYPRVVILVATFASNLQESRVGTVCTSASEISFGISILLEQRRAAGVEYLRAYLMKHYYTVADNELIESK